MKLRFLDFVLVGQRSYSPGDVGDVPADRAVKLISSDVATYHHDAPAAELVIPPPAQAVIETTTLAAEEAETAALPRPRGRPPARKV